MLVKLITYQALIVGWQIDVLRPALECEEISSTSLNVLPLISVLLGSCQDHPRVYDSGAHRSPFRHSLPLEQLLAVTRLTVKLGRRPNLNHQQ